MGRRIAVLVLVVVGCGVCGLLAARFVAMRDVTREKSYAGEEDHPTEQEGITSWEDSPVVDQQEVVRTFAHVSWVIYFVDLRSLLHNNSLVMVGEVMGSASETWTCHGRPKDRPSPITR